MKNPKPLPKDFAYQNGIMGRDELKQHYGVSGGMISHWRTQIGQPPQARRLLSDADKEEIAELSRTMSPTEIAAKLGRHVTTVRRHCIYYTPKRQVQKPGAFRQSQRMCEKRSSLQLMLSDIASHDRCPVFLCTRNGKPKSDGNMVRYGTKIITVAAAEAKAARKGLI